MQHKTIFKLFRFQTSSNQNIGYENHSYLFKMLLLKFPLYNQFRIWMPYFDWLDLRHCLKQFIKLWLNLFLRSRAKHHGFTLNCWLIHPVVPGCKWTWNLGVPVFRLINGLCVIRLDFGTCFWGILTAFQYHFNHQILQDLNPLDIESVTSWSSHSWIITQIIWLFYSANLSEFLIQQFCAKWWIILVINIFSVHLSRRVVQVNCPQFTTSCIVVAYFSIFF